MTAKKKPLSRLKNTSKGPIHHVEIHPAKNSRGGRAFITRIYRKPTPAAQAAADKLGRYLPDQTLDPSQDEHVHDDGQEMLGHVAKLHGIAPANDDGDADDDMDEGEE